MVPPVFLNYHCESPNAFLLHKLCFRSGSSFDHPEVFICASSFISAVFLSVSPLCYLNSLNETSSWQLFPSHSNKHYLPYSKTKNIMFFLHHTVKFSLINLEQETPHIVTSVWVRNIFVGTRSVNYIHPSRLAGIWLQVLQGYLTPRICKLFLTHIFVWGLKRFWPYFKFSELLVIPNTMQILFCFRNNDRENKPAHKYVIFSPIYFNPLLVMLGMCNKLGGPSTIPGCFFFAYQHDFFSLGCNIFHVVTLMANRETMKKVVIQYYLMCYSVPFPWKKHVFSFNIHISLCTSCSNNSYTSLKYQMKRHEPWV